MIKAVLVNYNYVPVWLKETKLDYILYDRSDLKEYTSFLPPERVIPTPNIGNVDYDKLTYLVENYNHLPDVFVWGKANLFKYVDKETFQQRVKERQFAPLLKKDHRVYADSRGLVNYYHHGMYCERNDSWYLAAHPAQAFHSWGQWAVEFNLPVEDYIPFPPGGNFILTRERIHRHPKGLYEAMRDTLPYTQLPGEAQLCERSYYYLWR